MMVIYALLTGLICGSCILTLFHTRSVWNKAYKLGLNKGREESKFQLDLQNIIIDSYAKAYGKLSRERE